MLLTCIKQCQGFKHRRIGSQCKHHLCISLSKRGSSVLLETCWVRVSKKKTHLAQVNRHHQYITCRADQVKSKNSKADIRMPPNTQSHASQRNQQQKLSLKQTLAMHVHNILNTLGKPAVYNVMKINWTTKSLSLKMALMFTVDIWSTISLERTLLNKFT